MTIGILRSTALAVLGLMVGGAATARAGPLNPLDFQPLAATFPGAAGVYTIDTSGSTPTLTGPGVNISGVLSPDGSTAVFDFGSIDIGAAESIAVIGSRPVALLSQQGMIVAGTIDGSAGYANQVLPQIPTMGGPGGADVGAGPGAGNVGSSVFVPYPGVPGYGTELIGGGGGGAFGGHGGGGTAQSVSIPVPGYAAGGTGGAAYANGLTILNALQGGSGGGLAVGGINLFAGGGGGGGAIELGAVNSVAISGTVRVDGSAAAFPASPYPGYGGGGGSGGAILLAAASVSLTGTLSAAGGDGGSGYLLDAGPVVYTIGAGGGGGGGVVAVDLTSTGGSFLNEGGTIDLAGGQGGVNFSYSPPFTSADDGAAGNFLIAPEPSGLMLAGVGLLGVLGYGRRARHRRPGR